MNPSEVHVRSNVPRLVRGPRRRTRTSSIPRNDRTRLSTTTSFAPLLVATRRRVWKAHMASSRHPRRSLRLRAKANAPPSPKTPSPTKPKRRRATPRPPQPHRHGELPTALRVRPFCGPTPRAPREDPRPRGCARERALDPSSAHLAPRGGLRGTARVQHGPSDGTLRCVFWFV